MFGSNAPIRCDRMACSVLQSPADTVGTGRFIPQSTERTVLSVEFEPGGDLITGDSEGHITTWSISNDGQYYKGINFKVSIVMPRHRPPR